MNQNQAPDNKTGLGIFLMCFGVAALCLNDATAKALGDTYSPLQILFLRNIIALPFAFLLVLKLEGPAGLSSTRPFTHVSRGFFWIFAAYLFFTSFRYLGLAEATTLVFIAPMFVTALSVLFFSEKVGWRRWSAVIAGLAGVVIVMRPGSGTFEAVSLLPLATALLYACLMLSARWVDPKESVWTLMLYLVGTGALLSALTLPFVWVPVRSEDLWIFLTNAVFGTAGITMITQAFRLAPASVVAPLDYTALLWAVLLGWLFWNEIPDWATYVGAAVIVASGIFIVLREQTQKSTT
ncbi:DMT family transporter [Roseibium alexandrii]|uniref:DMT family transporter n=1 Tax=Roseibium alexandrii TaxID=388408 RepID=UPI0037500BCE